MKLYPKKLRNLTDLEKEKKKLSKQIKLLDKDELLSLKGVSAKSKDKDDDEKASLFDLLPIDNPLIKMAVTAIGKRLLKPGAPKTGKKQFVVTADGNLVKTGKGKQIIKKAAIEFIGGYLKWKAIELSYKGVKHLMKKAKDNKATKKAVSIIV